MNETPISTCLASHPSLLPLHMVSDLILAVAFFAIAGAIVLYNQKKQPEFSSISYAVAGFVFWFGVVTALTVISYFYPIHFIVGIAKAITALGMIIFAITLFPLMPSLVQMITPREYEGLLHETLHANHTLDMKIAAAETKIKILENELTNRVRHILATVHGFAKETARSSTDITSYLKKFNARLGSLSSMNNLLLANEWKGATMRQVVYSQLEMYSNIGLDRAQVTGPEVYLNPEAVEHLSMAFHELAANSAGHRAKANGSEPTSITWIHHQDEHNQSNNTLRLSWLEPMDELSDPNPSHKGFGHVVLNFVVPTALNGLSELRFQDQGVVWELEVPVSNLCAA